MSMVIMELNRKLEALLDEVAGGLSLTNTGALKRSIAIMKYLIDRKNEGYQILLRSPEGHENMRTKELMLGGCVDCNTPYKAR